MPPVPTQDARRRPTCAHCGASFSHRARLSRHRRRTGHKSPTASPSAFPCPVCARPFPRRDNLQRHVRLVHPSTAHTCGVCNASLPSAERLAAHELEHDESIVAPLRELKAQEALALTRDREVRALRAAAWRKAKCDVEGCTVSLRATAATGAVATCGSCERRFHPDCMGYDEGMVARGGALVCVPCLARAGRDPAATVTADRRRQLLYAAVREKGLEVMEGCRSGRGGC